MSTVNLADKYTATTKKTELFSDFGVNLQNHPTKKDLVRITNENAIKRSIVNLLSTDYYERMYQPYVGANLKHLLFEPVGEEVLAKIRQQILACVSKFEPRANVTNLALTVSDDEHSIYVTLTFAVYNSTAPSTIQLILNRVR